MAHLSELHAIAIEKLLQGEFVVDALVAAIAQIFHQGTEDAGIGFFQHRQSVTRRLRQVGKSSRQRLKVRQRALPSMAASIAFWTLTNFTPN